MLEPRKYTVKQLLQADYQYVIPSYQRGYDWKGDTQVKDLFEDLKSSMGSEFNNSLFLGTMIFDISKQKSASIVEIIDGQQRFTTLMITIIAARNYAKRMLENLPLTLEEQRNVRFVDPYQEHNRDRFIPSE